MNTLNKLLARLGYKLTRTDGIGDFALLQQRHQELMAKLYDGQVEADALRAESNELRRKLANKTASEYYWRKQARKAREVIE